MPTLLEAAKQALTALEDVMADFDGSWALADTAIASLRQAIAAEQEPAAWFSTRTGLYNTIGEGMPLYAAPPERQWVEPSDEQLLQELKTLDASTARLPTGFRLFARAVLKLAKELNT